MRNLLLVAVFLPTTLFAFQAERVPLTFEKPGEREFVVDKANMLTSAQESQIKATAEGLLTSTGRPLLVVTIESMTRHGGSGLQIKQFSRYLFGQLGLGRDDVEDGNRGILFVVSRQDRKAAIELGADWPVSADRKSEEIMQRAIIPRFRQGDFGGGIVRGVGALAVLARAPDAPSAERREPAQSGAGADTTYYQTRYPNVDTHYVEFRNTPSNGPGGFCCVGLFFVLLMPLLGRGGGFFSIVSMILFGMASNVRTSSRRYRDDDDDGGGGWFMGGGGSSGGGFGGFGGGGGSSSGGGFSGGSFGGGFSGGGGASGSW